MATPIRPSMPAASAPPVQSANESQTRHSAPQGQSPRIISSPRGTGNVAAAASEAAAANPERGSADSFLENDEGLPPVSGSNVRRLEPSILAMMDPNAGRLSQGSP